MKKYFEQGKSQPGWNFGSVDIVWTYNNNFFTLPPGISHTAWKVSKYGVISGPYFLVFGLNTEIYSENLRSQSENRKTQTRNNSVFGRFSRSDIIPDKWQRTS